MGQGATDCRPRVMACLGAASAIVLLLAQPVQGVAYASSTPASRALFAAGTDFESECRKPYVELILPDNASIAGVTDAGQTITLETLLMLDGVTKKRARQVMDRVAAAYAPIKIDVVERFKRVSFPSEGTGPTGVPAAETQSLIESGKQAVGGARPEGVDVVLVLTSKDVHVDGRFSVMGRADCIGGVRYPERAFAVGEADPPGFNVPELVQRDLGAVVAAHEIGHLLGAVHEHSNCVEGIAERLTEPGVSPCTIMDSDLATLNALRFATLEAAVIRGYATDFASP